MIETNVSLYYSDAWDAYALRQGNKIILKALSDIKGHIPQQLHAKFSDGWFHDSYIIQIQCQDANSLCLSIRRRDEIANFICSSISSFDCIGHLLDKQASFPYPDNIKPIAQILDIWVELADDLLIIILLDNSRYLQVHCQQIQLMYGESNH